MQVHGTRLRPPEALRGGEVPVEEPDGVSNAKEQSTGQIWGQTY